MGRSREAPPEIVGFGDGAFLIELGDRVDRDLNRRARMIGECIENDRSLAWGRPIVSIASVLVTYDVLTAAADSAAAALRVVLDRAMAMPVRDDRTGATVEIRVRYGGRDGPDLRDVAERLGLRERDVIEAHASTTYEVFALGFSPGFAYLGELAAEIEVPRRATPRVHVPLGSVAIAGRQTAVYPSSTPGGWHLIGWTDTQLWDLSRARPALLMVGDRVRFIPRSGEGGS